MRRTLPLWFLVGMAVLLSCETSEPLRPETSKAVQSPIAALKATMDHSSDVETVRFVLHPLPTHAGPGPHVATCVDNEGNKGFSLIAGGVRWPDGIVDYKVLDPSGSGTGIGASDLRDAAEAAFAAYDFAAGIQFNENSASDNSVGFGVIDGEGGAIGFAAVAYNPATKLINEFDIVLDQAESWAIFADEECPTPAEGTDFDVQNILTHEVGHGLGLDHVNSPRDGTQTMYRYTQEGETLRRSLNNGDEVGINTLY